MKITHRFALRPTPSQQRELEALGVSLPSGSLLPGERFPFVAFEVAETDPNWLAITQRLKQWGVAGPSSVQTKFSRLEILGAQWLCVMPEWHHGYPQPHEDDNGYLQATYDLSQWCPICGVGLIQKAPFQMKSEPKWGRNSILQLNWIFEEYFVRPEIWSRIFAPLGIPKRPVLDRRGHVLETVVQLAIEEDIDIETGGLTGMTCPSCGRIKYPPWTRGPYPPLKREPDKPLVRTRQYFGSGAAADRDVLIRRDIARTLIDEKIRGVSLWPVEPFR